MSTHQEELLAKKARLAELKRQRELRQEQLASKRQSIGQVCIPVPLTDFV
jgi:dynein intermediate chain, cytosolic